MEFLSGGTDKQVVREKEKPGNAGRPRPLVAQRTLATVRPVVKKDGGERAKCLACDDNEEEPRRATNATVLHTAFS